MKLSKKETARRIRRCVDWLNQHGNDAAFGFKGDEMRTVALSHGDSFSGFGEGVFIVMSDQGLIERHSDRRIRLTEKGISYNLGVDPEGYIHDEETYREEDEERPPEVVMDPRTAELEAADRIGERKYNRWLEVILPRRKQEAAERGEVYVDDEEADDPEYDASFLKEDGQFYVDWIPEQGIYPDPDPTCQEGKVVRVAKRDQLKVCNVRVPYPGRGLGRHLIKCWKCGRVAGILTTGRPDDPHTVVLPCQLTN